jgi:hypothetical protein
MVYNGILDYKLHQARVNLTSPEGPKWYSFRKIQRVTTLDAFFKTPMLYSTFFFEVIDGIFEAQSLNDIGSVYLLVYKNIFLLFYSISNT